MIDYKQPLKYILLISLTICLAALASGETIYFLVAESNSPPVHGDSYVLPLSNPNDITHARDLIEHGPGVGQPIVVASIDAGKDGINRDYRAAGKPAWSWYVMTFNDFADFTAEILDGYPGGVESDVDWWIGNTGGTIGFWSYTVVQELGTNPETLEM